VRRSRRRRAEWRARVFKRIGEHRILFYANDLQSARGGQAPMSRMLNLFLDIQKRDSAGHSMVGS
jgi:hypothetical protein